jgi:hypothetical protein
MKHLFIARRATMLAVAGILALGAGMAPAWAHTIVHSRQHAALGQPARVAALANARSSVQVDFTCPAATVCLFPQPNYAGNYGPPWVGPAELATEGLGGRWISFSDKGVSPNPGSASDNSGSALFFYDKKDNAHTCVAGGGRTNLFGAYGWFYLTFGVKACGALPQPLP